MDADEIVLKQSNLPKALEEKPIITKMLDNSLTLLWIPSIPEQPRFPVSYVVEFSKMSDGMWVVYHERIKDIRCDVVGLEPFEDYGFRVRVENKFGLSDPSPVVTALRSQLKDRDTHKRFFKSHDDYVPKYEPTEKMAAAPVFVREEENSMYGIKGQPTTIEFWVYGFPEPEITWFFNDKKIEGSENFKFLKDRNGRTCLFINNVADENFGYYTCVAKNEHGEEKKTIRLTRADAPKFTKIFQEIKALSRTHIQLQCSVQGIPDPAVKWFKDFKPLHDTSRIKIIGDSPDNLILVISDAMVRDSGLYSCTATNIAGSRRGTQSIIYHVVNRENGKSYAAKTMKGNAETKQYINSELDIMNQLGSHEKLAQLHDCFTSSPYSMSLISDIAGGGSLLNHVLQKATLSENEVADYIKQVLEGLNYMHYKNIGHFGLTINDILMQRLKGSDIVICDFGLAKRIAPGASYYVEFGHPEFVSPEIVDRNSVTLTTDVWSAGIVTHILLTGISPFFGENDKETLCNIKEKKIDLSDAKLGHLSDQARDFLRKTLDYDPRNRLDVKSALNHPWIKNSSHSLRTSDLGIMEKLRNYKSQSDRWDRNSACKRYYRRRPLHSCLTHPSRMIYPPDEQYSPAISPEREIRKFNVNVAPFENIYPPSFHTRYTTENFTSDSHYQCGPDTYLLQLRDTDFPARIRRYMRFAASHSPMMALNLKQAHWGRSTMGTLSGNFSQVSIKERRKFTDIMDEEINDEIRGYGSRKPRRLAREVGTPLYFHGEWRSLRKETGIQKTEIDDSNHTLPYFREKLKDVSYASGEDVVLTCYAVGEPDPTYTWFRNESIIIETQRTKVKRLDDGRCQLILQPSKEYDIGVYKCVARNSLGSAVCRARLFLGDVPGNVVAPSIKKCSSSDVLLQWISPKELGDAYVQCYRLESKLLNEHDWTTIADDLKQEYYLATGLKTNQSYHFRLSAMNKFGWSKPSPPSQAVVLQENDDIMEQTRLNSSMQYQLNGIKSAEWIPKIDYSSESEPVSLIKSDYKELYDFKSIIATGRFSVIAKAQVKDGSRKVVACKCLLAQSENESSANNEYEISKSLVHDKIAKLLYANRDTNLYTLATELCCGLNILTYLERKSFYNEQLVTVVISQILDAIEYLHFRCIALLELQPDNVLMVDERSQQIKLTDFSNSCFVTNKETKVVTTANPEFIVAPELIRNERVSLPYSDIWTVGVLSYILLSGHSPFKGIDPKETAQNVIFVRYLFERLYPNVTQEAIRFLLSVFKLTEHKRPTIEECHESKWLMPNDFMLRKREAASFSTDHIFRFSREFFAQKESKHSRLIDLMGLKE
ncbi:unc-89-like protein 3 [Sarcoptes scabiei]|uniref:Unc-89-like protein 3 n=1 Tax=Sarcoptes scabiei TaxID=52283 RepID=A0A132AMU5_SARSC|nr:unc-89-like protein 3 [Sarcoptes scabiei]